MEASLILDEAGYIDWDENGIRNMPNNGPDVVLDVICRSDHAKRWEPAKKLCEDLNRTSIGYNLIPVDAAGAWERVLVNKDFHVYTGWWETSDVVGFWLYITDPTFYCQINDPVLRNLVENTFLSSVYM
ncbi:MAG: hypothetical protein QXK93_07790 [Candidatus Bathyarchaeia archaeon]